MFEAYLLLSNTSSHIWQVGVDPSLGVGYGCFRESEGIAR